VNADDRNHAGRALADRPLPAAGGPRPAASSGPTGGFELLEHTADVGIRARGATMREAFEQATLGLAEVLGAWRPDEEGDRVPIALEGDDPGGLLVDWLNEVLYLHEVREAALAGVRVDRVGDGHLEGQVTLVPLGDRPAEGISVKAATYHHLRVEPENGGWLVEVYLDV
jgi:SHS2 domain-containing protein